MGRDLKNLILVFFLYSFIAIVYTFPLVFKLGSSIYGFAGDNLGATHYLWWWKYTFLNHLDVRNSFLEQAPFGFKIDSETGALFYYWPLKVLTLVFNEVVAYNLVLFLSFPLAAASVYLLVKYVLTGFFAKEEDANSRTAFLISLWAGFVFSFSPYHFWKSYNHLDLALIWPFPLAVLFLLKLISQLRENKFRLVTVFLCALFNTATVLTNFYYGYFLIILESLVSATFYFFYRLELKSTVTSLLLVLFFSGAAVAPAVLSTIVDAYINKGDGQSAARVANYDRPLLDVVSLTARPWDYLIPSQDNPVFGTAASTFYKWIRDQGKDFKVISGPVHERTIFLGFVSSFLVFIGIVLLVLKMEFRRKYGRFLIAILLITFILVIISMPPYLFLKGKFTIYLPSYFLYKLVPMFRTYSRLGIFVLMFVVLGASVVLNYLGGKFGKRAALCGFAFVVIFSALEFLNVPPSKVIDLKEPSAMKYVGQQPGGFSFVVYPKEFNVAELLAFQPQFRKGFLNFHSQSEYYKLWGYLEDFKNPRVYSILSSLGVRYAIFQKKLIFAKPNPVDDLWYTRALRNPLGALPSGVDLERDFEDSSVYRITANPVGFVVFGKERTSVFPKTPYTTQDAVLRIYLANVRNTTGVRFGIKIKGLNGEELKYTKIDGENVVIRQSPSSVDVSFESERGFIDVYGIEGDTEIGSISIEGQNGL
jgi:hypothetical protein